jgi:transcriptional regulator with XRE-family HTH domain
MPTAATLVRTARARAGLTQSELARRAGMTQPAIARLERAGANPTFETLDTALRAAGWTLTVEVDRSRVGIDPGLVAEQLRRSPRERLHSLESMYEQARALAQAGEQLR